MVKGDLGRGAPEVWCDVEDYYPLVRRQGWLARKLLGEFVGRCAEDEGLQPLCNGRQSLIGVRVKADAPFSAVERQNSVFLDVRTFPSTEAMLEEFRRAYRYRDAVMLLSTRAATEEMSDGY